MYLLPDIFVFWIIFIFDKTYGFFMPRRIIKNEINFLSLFYVRFVYELPDRLNHIITIKP